MSIFGELYAAIPKGDLTREQYAQINAALTAAADHTEMLRVRAEKAEAAVARVRDLCANLLYPQHVTVAEVLRALHGEQR